MSKGHFPTRIDPVNLPRRLREGLEEAESLLDKKKPGEALELLHELDKRYPNQVDVLGLMANANYDLQDNHGYLRALRKLYHLAPNRAEVKLGLAGAYLANMLPVLALVTFREFQKRWPQHERAGDVMDTIKKLEENVPKMLEDGGLNYQTELDFAFQHEEVQACLSSDEYSRAKSLIEKMQRQKPDFVAPLNNLSQIYWLEGDLPRAVETCHRVLAVKPDNIHALANLIRFLYLTGRKDETPPYLERLKGSKAEAAERWKKIAEVLSFIGDDQGMLELAKHAETEAHPIELDEYFYHFLAVSEWMLGQEEKARSHWKRALKINPHFTLAQENLADLKKPKYEQNGPWSYPFGQMLPEAVIREMTRVVERVAKHKDEDAFQPTVQRFLDTHPELLQLALLLLERGDHTAKEFVINMADMSGHPGFLLLLKEFAFGQHGSDELRIQAAQVLSKHNAAPTGEVNMWIKGGWTPILLLGFEITPEPMLDENPLSPKALDLMKQAIEALHEENSVAAEQHLRKALSIQPEHPGLLNNLALALSMQGRKAESDAVIKHVTEDFPDYFFGQMARARKAIFAKDHEKARTIMNHWMETKKKYHVTEYNMLCKTQIDLMLAEDKIDGAISWLEMWEKTEPDDPDYESYKEHLNIWKTLSKFKNRQRKSKKQ